jgi:lipopolysaccharide transport system ATP-binding protein
MAEPILIVDHVGKAWPIDGAAQRSATVLGSVYSSVKNLFRSPPSDQSRLYWALRDVSLSVARGELVGLIGQGGAGKSALLKVISRVMEPSHGRVRLRGRVAAMMDAKIDFHLELTARENIFLRGAILGMTRREIRNRFDELVDFAELGKFLNTPLKYYSLGMTTCLSFAVAAHLDSEIVLIDEVFSFGAAVFREKCMAKLRHEARAKGRAVLFVSQDMDAIRQLCPRAILMDRGSVVADGPAEETIRAYQATLSTSAFNATTDPGWEVLGC